MKLHGFIMVLLAVLMLSACGGPQPEPSFAPTPVPTPKKTAEPTPAPSPTPDNTARSYTTGLPFDGPYMPVLVVIENASAARPQTGLQDADVVYEVPVESSITRFVCVYSDHVPEEVMPVRSARTPFLYIQGEWDGILMHFGAAGRKKSQWSKPYSVYGHSLFGKAGLIMDGLSSKWKNFFFRTSNAKSPHNVVGRPLLAQELHESEAVPPGWFFNDKQAYSGEPILEINLKMCAKSDNFVSYTYDKSAGVYLRFMSGKPFIAAETKQQVQVKNIIVQYSTYKSSAGRKLWDLVGSGQADYYIGGVKIQGRWERTSEDARTVFYDDKGEPIVLHPGNTWVHISPV